MRHFLVVGQKGELIGLGWEILQQLASEESAFDSQDFLSNYMGEQFFENYNNEFLPAEQLAGYFNLHNCNKTCSR